jgi:hypothetical protein
MKIYDTDHLKWRIRNIPVTPEVLIQAWQDLEYRLSVCEVTHIDLYG